MIQINYLKLEINTFKKNSTFKQNQKVNNTHNWEDIRKLRRANKKSRRKTRKIRKIKKIKKIKKKRKKRKKRNIRKINNRKIMINYLILSSKSNRIQSILL